MNCCGVSLSSGELALHSSHFHLGPAGALWTCADCLFASPDFEHSLAHCLLLGHSWELEDFGRGKRAQATALCLQHLQDAGVSFSPTPKHQDDREPRTERSVQPGSNQREETNNLNQEQQTSSETPFINTSQPFSFPSDISQTEEPLLQTPLLESTKISDSEADYGIGKPVDDHTSFSDSFIREEDSAISAEKSAMESPASPFRQSMETEHALSTQTKPSLGSNETLSLDDSSLETSSLSAYESLKFNSTYTSSLNESTGFTEKPLISESLIENPKKAKPKRVRKRARSLKEKKTRVLMTGNSDQTEQQDKNKDKKPKDEEVKEKKTEMVKKPQVDPSAFKGLIGCAKCHTTLLRLNMIQHVVKCTGLRPYGCTACAYATTQKGNAKRHLLAIHDDRAEVVILNKDENDAAVREGLKLCFPNPADAIMWTGLK